jgi:hypothetical protein
MYLLFNLKFEKEQNSELPNIGCSTVKRKKPLILLANLSTKIYNTQKRLCWYIILSNHRCLNCIYIHDKDIVILACLVFVYILWIGNDSLDCYMTSFCLCWTVTLNDKRFYSIYDMIHYTVKILSICDMIQMR